jgi:hypothetical protein
MCNFLSGVTLATGEIAIGEMVDSHEAIIEQAGWQNADKNALGKPGLCRWEYTPPNNDISMPLAEWGFHIDEQQTVPDWWTPEHEATAVARAHTVLDKMILREGKHEINSGRVFLLGSSTATLWDSSTATLWGSSTATLRDSSTATLRGSSTATLLGSSTATLWDSSTATLRDSSTATLRDSSTATLWDSSTATLRDSSAKIAEINAMAIAIYRIGDTIKVRGAHDDWQETK